MGRCPNAEGCSAPRWVETPPLAPWSLVTAPFPMGIELGPGIVRLGTEVAELGPLLSLPWWCIARAVSLLMLRVVMLTLLSRVARRRAAKTVGERRSSALAIV